MNMKPDKINMAMLPTPIIRLKSLSEALNKNIWIKRDDLTGVELSGNKVRKLEYIFQDILDKKSDYVITCGGKQSNHCRAVAAAAARYGIKCRLVLSGKDDGPCSGNLFLDRLLGAETTFINQSESMDEAMTRAFEELAEKGYKPYIIPLGGSNPLGSNGYVDAYNEITEFESENSIWFDVIALAVGSGGTYAGLLAANEKNTVKKIIAGISVLAEVGYISGVIAGICTGLDINVHKNEINITDGYIGEGYGIASAEVIKFIKETAAADGLLLDPVYTGKALFGLKSEIEKGTYCNSDNILFIHTGGIFGTFSQTDIFNL